MALDLSTIQGVILDMDGVLWRDKQPIGDLPAIFGEFNRRGWQVTLATNNATLSLNRFIDKLAGFGVQVEPGQIVTSGQAVAHHLAGLHPGGGPVYVIGESGVLEELAAKGFYPSADDPLAVVIGMDRALTFDKLRTACLLIRRGAAFIGTNPDRTYPTPDGLVPGGGAIIALMEAATDQAALIMGKPAPEMYKIALERMGLPPQAALVVGDRAETDILGAQPLGCRTCLVLSGVTSAERAHSWQPPPDLIAADLAALVFNGVAGLTSPTGGAS